ncbi:iron export ABC transporter permease subunit FetB [uncultured Hyphomicrobium sp.]|uniref:ABC transporter permease n=1 Tax=uncultured Hyphomicrobium sp. TaxID=194373 RepID=UPI002600F6D1|nr:iron export ABC transporter permease subunit FetB [uncultured Hyphomicrobium sp.]
MTYVPLEIPDLALAALLLIANGVVSFWFRLGLERSLAISAVRMILQLAVVALALRFIFALNSPLWTVLFAMFMAGAAAFEVISRQERRVVGPIAMALGAGAPFFAGLVATLFATTIVIGPDPWYAPRYVLPLFGMMLGNAMAGTSLVLDAITSAAVRERAAIEARLALGASRFEALDGILRRALTTGLMPILSAMATTGVVALPGMMTGQILAGIDPVSAAKYQVMIMFLIAGSTGIAVVAAGLGAVLLITDERHRLRLDRLSKV